MSAYTNWPEGDLSPWEKVNEGFAASGQALLYAHRKDADTGLTVGYGGGSLDGNTVADGTVTGLTDNATNYLVVNRSTRAVTSSTGTTNWDDTTTYGKMARAVFASGVLTWYDERWSVGGILRNPPSTSASGQFPVDGTPASDDSWAGRAITGVNAGATIAQWEAVYMGSGGKWLLADASDDTAAPMRGLAAEAGTDNNPMSVVTEGVIRNDAWNWTIGGTLYLSTTAGGLTQAAPSATGEIVQAVGFAITADVIYLNVGAATFIELA